MSEYSAPPSLKATAEHGLIGVAGCGMWGKNIIRNLKKLGVLHAVHDHHDERAAEYAQMFDCQKLSYEEMLSDNKISGIVLATAAPSHATLACAALAKGKHIFIEKPMALTLQDAQQIAQAAQAENRQVMIGHLIRYHPVFQQLNTLAHQGIIGEIRHIQANRLAMGRIRSTESVIFDLCPHDLAIILALTEGALPEQVSCQFISHITPDIADMALTSMRFSDSLTAQMHTSWMSPLKEHRLTVTGSTGALVFDDTRPWAEKLAHYPHHITRHGEHFHIDRAEVRFIEVAEAEPLSCEMQAFIHSCATNTPALTSASEGVAVQQILEMMHHHAVELSPAQKMSLTP